MISIPVLSAKEGNRYTYTGKLSFGQFASLFHVLPETTPVEVKQQRDLSKSRIGAVKKYLTSNDDFLFSGTVAIISDLTYKPLQVDGGSGVSFGELSFKADSQRFIIDGQGRLGGVQAAIEEMPELADTNFIDVKFVEDLGIDANRRIFVDLNKNAARSSQAINIAFDTREVKSVFTKRTLDAMPELKAVIDYEKTSATGSSNYIWTINQFSKFITAFLGLSDKDLQNIIEDEQSMDKLIAPIKAYWAQLMTNKYISEAIMGDITPTKLRESSVLGTAIMLEVLGSVGSIALDNVLTLNKSWDAYDLTTLDFSKSSKQWLKRMVDEDGYIIKNKQARLSTTLLITTTMGLVPSVDLLNQMAA